MAAGFGFGRKSRANLYGAVGGVKVRPELVELCEAVIRESPIDFMIVDGVRTVAEQRTNVAKGYSRTMRSKHLVGHAIDFCPLDKDGKPDWTDIVRWGSTSPTAATGSGRIIHISS